MLSDFLSRNHTDCSVKEFEVHNVSSGVIKPFIINNHYSHSCHITGCPVSFSLMHENEMIGTMVYGYTAMVNQWKAFTEYGVEQESDMLELRRLVCIDDTPRNTESYFIGKTLKWLKRYTDYKIIVSYADPHHGHAGTIYKASDFKHVGMSAPGKIIDFQGRRYHDKSIRDYNRAHCKKTGEKIPATIALKLQKALESGDAQMVPTPGKHIYVYNLR